MSNEEVKKELEQLFGKLDTEKLLKRIFYGGFDTYEDYEKYGDAFVRIKMPNDTLLPQNADVSVEDRS